VFLDAISLVEYEDEISSLDKLEWGFVYRSKYLKRRIMYSHGHPGSFNPAVITNKEIWSNVKASLLLVVL